MKFSSAFYAAVLLLAVIVPPSFAHDVPSDGPKDAELKMLRAAVKKQAEEMQPLRDKVKAQAAEIQKLTDDLASLRRASENANSLKKIADELRQNLTSVTSELEALKLQLSARDEELSQANAKLRASIPTTGASPSSDPVKDEFVTSFSKFSSDLEPAFRDAYKNQFKRGPSGFEGSVSNFKADVISTNSAMNPLVGVVTVACHHSYSVQRAEYGSLRVEDETIVMRFSREKGRWKLLDASKRTTKVRGNDSLGKNYDSDGGAESDFSQAPVVRSSVTSAHGLLPQ